MTIITFDGVDYYQPECRCQGGGHICYMRPMPTVVPASALRDFEATFANGSGTQTQPPTPKSKETAQDE